MWARLGIISGVLGVVSPVFAEDCAVEGAFLLDAVSRNGWVVDDAGDLSEVFKTCKLRSIVLEGQSVRLDVAELSWTFAGLGAIEAGDGTVSVEARLDNLRIVPKIDDPWLQYTMEQQNRRSLTDAELSGTWNFSTGRVEIERLAVDLPGDNALTVSMAADGVGHGLLTQALGGLSSAALRRVEIVATNSGFADGLVLAALTGAMSGMPGTPEGQMEATRRDARAILEELPGDILVEGSKEALGHLIDDAPVPWGTLEVTLHAEPALPLLRFSALALASDPLDPGALGFAFSGADVEINYLPAAGAE